jgi:hypothetical protein
MSETLFQLKQENSTTIADASISNKEIKSLFRGKKYRIGEIKVNKTIKVYALTSHVITLSHELTSKTFSYLLYINIPNSKHATGFLVEKSTRLSQARALQTNL